MSSSFSSLSPQPVWNHFASLNAIPRGSKKEKGAIAFMKTFGESLGLPVTVDQAGNVIIKKPATKGMENRETVALQGHLDMVHQKNADTRFDFDTQGIKMKVDGDWVKAEGTTLGADNGIGVASIMSLLASTDIPHPALEALFTIDEETGMTGALGLKSGLLHASILLNLDTEDDRELTIGCAGGLDVTATAEYKTENLPGGFSGFTLMVKGLTGGHSGMDIHRGRGNANKIMNRMLSEVTAQCGIRIQSIDGGGLRNAIPRESRSVFAVPQEKREVCTALVKSLTNILKHEYATTDPHLEIIIAPCEPPATVLPVEFQKALLCAVYACPNGIYRMSPDIQGLVQTSNNVARVLVADGKCTVMCLTRSSVDSEKMDEASAIRAAFGLMNAGVSFSGSYPGWTPNPDAGIVKLMSRLYREKFNSEPLVNACHAGLECGILGANYPGTEMISFGPNIQGAHSPDEKVQISSVQKFWGFLLDTLKNIPAKN